MESQNQNVENEYLKLPFGREHGTSLSKIRTQKHIAENRSKELEYQKLGHKSTIWKMGEPKPQSYNWKYITTLSKLRAWNHELDNGSMKPQF